MGRIVIATRNKNKVKEIKEILKDLPIEAVSLDELGVDVEVEEDGNTFEENALKKAAEIMKLTGLPALADDSGLEVDALDGAPGVYSARFAGIHGDDKKNNDKLLELMKNVPDEKRSARFVSVVALVYPDGMIITSEGAIKGVIGRKPAGHGGFGYDPLFIVPEYGKTFAELGSSVKNGISHRARAMKELRGKLMEIMQEGKLI